MCTVLLPPAGNPIAVNKYIISLMNRLWLLTQIRLLRPHSFTFLPMGHVKDLVYRENTLRHCRVLGAAPRVKKSRYEVC